MPALCFMTLACWGDMLLKHLAAPWKEFTKTSGKIKKEMLTEAMKVRFHSCGPVQEMLRGINQSITSHLSTVGRPGLKNLKTFNRKSPAVELVKLCKTSAGFSTAGSPVVV